MSEPLTIDLEASALLVAVLDGQGGDLRAAFAVLCARVTVEDVTGETFEGALARALGQMMGRSMPDFTRPEIGSAVARLLVDEPVTRASER